MLGFLISRHSGLAEALVTQVELLACVDLGNIPATTVTEITYLGFIFPWEMTVVDWHLSIANGAADTVQLDENEVHLWLVDLNRVERALIPHYLALMTDEEIERNRRYRFEEGRIADAVTRALVRTTLSRYRDVDPKSWVFSKGDHGKPEICAPGTSPPLRFNLSHTRGQVVCAVTPARRLGVDIEWVERRNSLLKIAERFFSPREVKDLFALPEAEQQSRFFDYWTLKEAYIKASGEGVALGLDNFSFYLQPTQPIIVSFTAAISECPGEWRFQLCNATPQHRLAVALHAGKATEMTVRLFDTVPLADPFRERFPVN